MSWVIDFFTKLFGVDKVILFIRIALEAIVVALTIAFYSFIVNGLLTAYGLINDVIDAIYDPSAISDITGVTQASGEVISVLKSVLVASGVMDGITASLPIVYSALMFLLLKYLYKSTLMVKNRLVDSIRGYGFVNK